MGMKNRLGRPVRGDDFLARTQEAQELWDLLDDGDGNVLVLAPRRVGKTSFLYHLHDQPKEGWFYWLMPTL